MFQRIITLALKKRKFTNTNEERRVNELKARIVEGILIPEGIKDVYAYNCSSLEQDSATTLTLMFSRSNAARDTNL